MDPQDIFLLFRPKVHARNPGSIDWLELTYYKIVTKMHYAPRLLIKIVNIIKTKILNLGMPLFQHFQVRDSTVCIIGLCSRIAGLILYALSPSTTVAFMGEHMAVLNLFCKLIFIVTLLCLIGHYS